MWPPTATGPFYESFYFGSEWVLVRTHRIRMAVQDGTKQSSYIEMCRAAFRTRFINLIYHYFLVCGPNLLTNLHLFKLMKLWIKLCNVTLTADLEGNFPPTYHICMICLKTNMLCYYSIILIYYWARRVSAVQASGCQQCATEWRKKMKGTREEGWREHLHTLETGPGWSGRQQRSENVWGTGEKRLTESEICWKRQQPESTS